MNSARCIYCTQFFDPTRGEGDHVLQAGVFGEFRSDRTFRGICVPCNNKFGAFEQELGQASPPGYFRNVVRPNRGRRGKRGSVMQRGTRGAPPPKHTMRVNGHDMLVQPSPENPRNATPVDQLLVVDAEGCEHPVRLFRGMSAEDLRARVAKVGGLGLKGASFECDAAYADEFKTLFDEAFPGTRVEDDYIIEPGEINLPGRVEFQFTGDYFRALAKTAFHYYLIHNRRGLSGHEEMFAPIRDFIKFGGDKDEFFHSSGRTLALPFGKLAGGGAITPNCWFHLLAGDETREVVVVFMLLFAGPEHVPSPNYVTLGRLQNDIILPTGVWGHQFIYQKDATGSYAGKVVDVSRMRLR